MEKTKSEEMFDRLPANIKETEVLRYSTKKVLAALLELLLHSEARESRVIFCQNNRLRKLSGVGSQELLPAIEQLIDYDLISRKVGRVRKEGETKGEASEYIINLKKLKEPIVEKDFDDLFGEFLNEGESLEKPINTTITTSITNSISTSTLTTNSSSTLISNPIEKPISKTIQIQEELKRPSSYKELAYYFIKRIDQECKDKNLDELNEIQASLKDELDEFNGIRDYQNIYKYIIIPSMNKKREKLKEKDFEEFITSV